MALRAVAIAGVALITSVRAAIGQDALANTPRLGELNGIVVDTSFRGLGEATIVLLGTKIGVVTGENGRFRIRRLPVGRYVLTAHRLGYEPVSAALDIGTDTLRLTLTMEPATHALDTVRVASTSLPARLAEFEARRRAGFGQFFTQADIHRRNGVYVTEMLRSLLSVEVLEVHDHGGALPSHYASSRRFSPNYCLMTVVLDNVVMPTPFDLDLLPPPSTIAGIELYSGPSTVPPIFAPYDRRCGVILVWTKSG
jgi:carboxypeptidase family protein